MNRCKGVAVVGLGVLVVMLSVFVAFAQNTTSPSLPTARPAVENIPVPGLLQNLQLVGSNPLVDPLLGIPRGMNAGLAIAGNCAFVGSRNGFQDSIVLDISNPATPTIAGVLSHIPGASAREVKALNDLNMLVIENLRRGGDSAVLGIPKGSIVQNALQIYQVPSPCTSISGANLKATLALEDKRFWPSFPTFPRSLPVGRARSICGCMTSPGLCKGHRWVRWMPRYSARLSSR